MADDQVKYSDLIVDDNNAFESLTKALNDVKTKLAEVKSEAVNLQSSMKAVGTATRKQQQATSAHAAAAENLRRKMSDLSDEEQKLEALRKRYKKLTDEEIRNIESLRVGWNAYVDAIKKGHTVTLQGTDDIDIQNKSYNELYQTYNALKDALNRMTTAERENTQAGKYMVDQAKRIRDTLNNLQQATGNYTLNVGNYMSALNGLQFQTQQVLREIPSAQNLSQFFLAISNNIPMFADALARYNQGLPEIKAKLAAVTAEIARQNAAMAAMNTQSAEYAAAQARLNELQRQQQQLQGASVSGWRAILKAVGSWQTLLIAGLLLLRKMPDIIKKISGWFETAEQKAAKLKNEINSAAASADVMAAALKKTTDESSELDLIVGRLKNIERGTDEWKTAIDRVNEITKSNLDNTTATVDQVYRVTAAYRDQAYQLALNQEIMGKIAKNNSDRLMTLEVLRADKFETVASIMGLEIGSKDYERIYKEWWDARRDQRFAQFSKSLMSLGPETYNVFYEDYLNELDKFGKDALRFIENVRKKYSGVMDNTAVADLENMYRITPQIKSPTTPKSPKTPNAKEPSERSMADQYWKAEEALLRAQMEGYELERALAKLNRDKQRDEQINWYVEQRLALDENLKNKFITEDEYNSRLQELDRENTALREDIDATYWKTLRSLRQKNMKAMADEWKANAAEVEKAEKENAKKLLDAEVQNWEKRRTQMVEQGKTRKEMLEAEFAAEIARLNIMKDLNRDVNGEKMSDEQRQKVEEWIRLLEQLQAAGNFRGIKLGSIFGKGASGLGGEKNKSGNYSNIMDVLFGEKITNDQISALNSVFDQAKEALNSWMDARKAAADQAKELADDEVSAAENALNREIELRNQGYANNVALRERELADAKEKQKQAVEEQKKIAQEQILLDAALQTSSLITASANIIKQFPNPLVWGPMLATMWGSFAFAKIKAYQASTKSIQFREGGVMMLEGGSHESGHDVNLGIGPDGSNLRAEGGEYFAVINKRNSRKYGSEIPAVVNALNSGMFEDRYIKTSDAVGMMGNVGLMGNMGEAVDLSAVESGVGELVKQGESRWTVEGEYRVERYKNRVRRVKIG